MATREFDRREGREPEAEADDGLTLKALCEESGVSERTVRYYQQQGLLPPAPRSGPGVRYPASQLWRLRLIRRWQDEYLPLEQIRKLLSDLGDAELEKIAHAGAPPTSAPRGRVADYVSKVLGKPAPAPERQAAPPRAPEPARSQWERWVLDADVELHVRRPLSHVMNRRVEALLAEAKRILSGATPPRSPRDEEESSR